MKKLLLILALSFAAPSLADAQQSQCLGKLCTLWEDLSFEAPPGWSIEVVTDKDGRGDADLIDGEFIPTCDRCKDCKLKYHWTYSGEAEMVSVTWYNNGVHVSAKFDDIQEMAAECKNWAWMVFTENAVTVLTLHMCCRCDDEPPIDETQACWPH